MKRDTEEANKEEIAQEDASIGPPKPKKRKELKFEKLYLEHLPNCENYEKSYMHRDIVTHVAVVPKTEFLITCSLDGHVKFWKKQPVGVEFMKHFRAHVAAIQGVATSPDGRILCTVAADKTVKIYDIVNFDMINMSQLTFVPGVCEFVSSDGATLAITDAETGTIHIYDTKSEINQIATVDVHKSPVKCMKFNENQSSVITCDAKGLIEYWSTTDYKFPTDVQFKFKTETDLYDLAKNKTFATSLSVSRDGELFAIMGRDRHVRVFRYSKGTLYRKYEESLSVINKMQKNEGENEQYKLDTMEFGRRMTIEQELELSWNSPNPAPAANVIFDESANFVIYATMIGIKVVNLYTNKAVVLLGKPETNNRFLFLDLYQGKIKGSVLAENLKRDAEYDPTLFCTSFKKNRFYMFNRRSPADSADSGAGRDILNEKPTREEELAMSKPATKRLGRLAVIHTSVGDIRIKLFADECPKTVENFGTHSKNGYYNNIIFHRVIKNFMIQTGDPLGDGTGGSSIWGHDFEDEFDRTLKHDRPFTVSMANTGAVNSNGSQFFITTVPHPALDMKHTVFGRVVGGEDVVKAIELVKTDKYDKPLEDIKIMSITLSYTDDTK